MGTVVHKATIVTTFDADLAHIARRAAVELFPVDMVTPVAKSPLNGYRSFAVLTCGSKLGWSDKDDDDDARKKFEEWIVSNAYDDGSNPIEFVTVGYGRDYDITHAYVLATASARIAELEEQLAISEVVRETRYADLSSPESQNIHDAGFTEGVEAAAKVASGYGHTHGYKSIEVARTGLEYDIATAIRALTPGGYVALPVGEVKQVREALNGARAFIDKEWRGYAECCAVMRLGENGEPQPDMNTVSPDDQAFLDRISAISGAVAAALAALKGAS